MNLLRTQKSSEATNELWSLANGPNVIVNFYSGCICNGVRFHTRDRDNRRRSQNSGLVSKGEHEGRAIDFYGYLCKVWEMTYIYGHKVVLFQCEWFNTGSTRTIQIDEHFTSIDVRSRWYKDDPFVLPSQVQQVFYVNDTKLGAHWQVVQRVQHRRTWDVPELEDDEFFGPNDVFQQDETNGVVPILVEDSNVQHHRTDANPETISSDKIMELTREYNDDEDEMIATDRDEEEGDEQMYFDSDLDIDLDIDSDM